jgi:hypothetical protein
VALLPEVRWCRPTPDRDAVQNITHGVNHRLVSRTDIDVVTLRHFRAFVHAELKKMPKLRDIMSLADWLACSNYSLHHQTDMLSQWEQERMRDVNNDDFVARAFIKAESYGEYKQPRIISGRGNITKLVFGPFVKSCELLVYHHFHENFVKNFPVQGRPELLMNIFGDLEVLETDYTSFESSIRAPIMNVCEWALFKHLHASMGQKYVRFLKLRSSLRFKNKLRKVKFAGMEPYRFSGDLHTSLGNGFTNLMLMKFACHSGGASFRGLVEGDDGLFVFDPRIDLSKITALGFKLKLKRCPKFTVASFCGIVCSADSLILDPIQTLLKLFVSFSHLAKLPGKRLGLLKSKAMSLLALAPRAPVVSRVASQILSELSNVIPVYDVIDARWEFKSRLVSLNDLRFACCSEVSAESREVCEAVFGVSVANQCLLEQYVSKGIRHFVSSRLFTEMVLCHASPDVIDFSYRYQLSFGNC